MTVQRFLERGQPGGLRLVLRHDVDRNPNSALRMARLENAFGIQATYYFRTVSLVFRPAIISAIHKLGHEVGYHYETLAKEKGRFEQAVRRFGTELRRMRNIVPVTTVSMHGSPLSPYNNLDMWKFCHWRDFDLLGDFSLSIRAGSAYYFTDTGRNWSDGRFNIRDRLPSLIAEPAAGTTEELIDFLRTRPTAPVLINTHPNRWAHNAVDWIGGLLTDAAANSIKSVISLRRGRGEKASTE